MNSIIDPTVSLTGPQITVLRFRLGFRSQAALAKRIGSSQPALCRREANQEPQSGPEIMLIVSLAKEASIEILNHDEAVATLAGGASSRSDEAAA